VALQLAFAVAVCARRLLRKATLVQAARRVRALLSQGGVDDENVADVVAPTSLGVFANKNISEEAARAVAMVLAATKGRPRDACGLVAAQLPQLLKAALEASPEDAAAMLGAIQTLGAKIEPTLHFAISEDVLSPLARGPIVMAALGADEQTRSLLREAFFARTGDETASTGARGEDGSEFCDPAASAPARATANAELPSHPNEVVEQEREAGGEEDKKETDLRAVEAAHTSLKTVVASAEAALKADVTSAEAALKADMTSAEAALKADVTSAEAALKADVTSAEAALKVDVAAAEAAPASLDAPEDFSAGVQAVGRSAPLKTVQMNGKNVMKLPKMKRVVGSK
jgi:hypothetical protein